MTAYRTVKLEGVAEFTDRRSRFIGQVRPVKSEQEAADFVDAVQRRYWDARHHVPAYILRVGDVRRFSDDGEPQGTAGMPVLDVLQKQALTDCAVVVTRYFGGILLGGGGLVRAYSHTAALAIKAAGIVEMRPALRQRVCCSYTQYGWLSALLENSCADIEDAVYADTVTVQYVLEADAQAAFLRQLTERSAGGLSPDILEKTYRAAPVQDEKIL